MKKIRTVQVLGNEILKGQKPTIGVGLGDLWSFLVLLERAMGIEPTSEAWEASILPLYDARSSLQLADCT
jgi:hypothetical protein